MLWLVGLWAVAVWADCVSGCGASAIRTQAQANLVVGETLTEAHGVIVEHVEGDLAGCQRAGGTEAAKIACTERVGERWGPLDEAHRVAADAHHAWSEALIAAVQAGETELDASSALSLLAAVVRAYRALIEAASDIGVQLPALPEVTP
jgi:hypothetical protein